jgi:hypothetical protein
MPARLCPAGVSIGTMLPEQPPGRLQFLRPPCDAAAGRGVRACRAAAA